MANFRDAGAHGVIVPGVIDQVRGMPVDLLPDAALTAVRLRADPGDLGRRLAARDNPFEDRAAIPALADALDRAFAGKPCVDTTGLTIAEVADRVLAHTGWPGVPLTEPLSARLAPGPAAGGASRPLGSEVSVSRTPDPDAGGARRAPGLDASGVSRTPGFDAGGVSRTPHPSAGGDQTLGRGAGDVERALGRGAGDVERALGPGTGEILWVCGPTAVGKSTVGWQVYQRIRQGGVTAAFVDLDQIGFRRPVPAGDPGNHRLKAANLASVWRSFRASGAACLIAVGPLERPEDFTHYADALPAAAITLCRLRASRRVLGERAALRGRGVSPASGLAGDELVGQPPGRLREIADQAARIDQTLGVFGDLHVDTDDRPAADIATEILKRTGHPMPA
ncbi:hypothetical protein [Actinoplanes sp. NBRC 103695]|uniref:hypothetical protein n=1 Tax=Actinoplanes sp. NBRC 103695 TaxID=3032202 RepID=UPI002556DF7D|nr:hypothetical protein [Actinoplanes sp. NBRC 103695]